MGALCATKPIPLHTSRNLQEGDGLRERKLLSLLTPRTPGRLHAIAPKLLIYKGSGTCV